jgi:signal transduction histidine kinase
VDLQILERLIDIGRQLAETRVLDPLLTQAMQVALELLGAERGYLVLLKEDGRLNFRVKQDQHGNELEEPEEQISHTILKKVVSTRKPLVTADATLDPELRDAESVQDLQLRSVMCVPLISRGQTLGAMYVENRSVKHAFRKTDLRPLALLAAQAAVSIENAVLNGELESHVVQRTTELQAANEQLQRQNDFLNSVLESLTYPFYVVDAHDYTVQIANAAARGEGAPEHSACYALLHARDEPCQGPDQPCPIEEIKRTRQPITVEHVHYDQDGNERYIEVHGYPLCDDKGDVVRVIEHCFDVTARVRAEEALREAAATAEREHLARELHDAVTQTLFTTSLIAEAMPRVWERHPEEGRSGLEQLRRLTQGALAEMRALLLELRPAALTERPLGESLRHLTQAMSNRTRSPVTLTLEGDRLLPPEVQVALYRITQEALNNAARHTRANQISVALDCQPEQVALRIRDDGGGFNLEDVLPDRLGLSIMQERAEDVGARLEIESQPGLGTQVAVVWAVDW